MVTLNVKRKEFEAIKNGQKKRDYRDASLFNKKKLLKLNAQGLFDVNLDIKEIQFINGYKKDSESVIMEVLLITPVCFVNAYENEKDLFTAIAGANMIEIELGNLKKGGQNG